MCDLCSMFFCVFVSYNPVKTILTLGAIQKPSAGWIWPIYCGFLTPVLDYEMMCKGMRYFAILGEEMVYFSYWKVNVLLWLEGGLW